MRYVMMWLMTLAREDGGIKVRRAQVVAEVKLFDLIDRMPMRRAEKG